MAPATTDLPQDWENTTPHSREYFQMLMMMVQLLQENSITEEDYFHLQD